MKKIQLLTLLFQASIHDDSVAYFLESLIPISKASEVKKIVSTIKSKNIEVQRKYIQSFGVKLQKTVHMKNG